MWCMLSVRSRCESVLSGRSAYMNARILKRLGFVGLMLLSFLLSSAAVLQIAEELDSQLVRLYQAGKFDDAIPN